MRTSISVTRWSQLSPKMHRWARTSWRSKPTELFVERHVWKQQPWSVLYIPIGILFVYYHGITRLWTLATVCDIGWGSRDLKAPGQPSPITKTQGAQDQAPVALCPRLDLAVAGRDDLTGISSVMSTISPPQLSDVLAKYQMGTCSHEMLQATSNVAGLQERHSDTRRLSLDLTHRRTRRFSIAV